MFSRLVDFFNMLIQQKYAHFFLIAALIYHYKVENFQKQTRIILNYLLSVNVYH